MISSLVFDGKGYSISELSDRLRDAASKKHRNRGYTLPITNDSLKTTRCWKVEKQHSCLFRCGSELAASAARCFIERDRNIMILKVDEPNDIAHVNLLKKCTYMSCNIHDL